MDQHKQQLNVIVVGNQRSGKSSITSHILCHCNGIDQTRAEHFASKADQSGKGSYKYAWVLEKLAEDRERGSNLKFSLWNFETAKYKVNIIDAPGYKDSLHETAAAATQVDCVVLVVSASVGEYEVGTSKNGLTYVHALIGYTLGVKQLIVCVNKMDLAIPSYSQERFKVIADDLERNLKAIGYDMSSVPLIPTSCFGDNIMHSSDYTPWYRGWSTQTNRGKTLIEAIDSVVRINESTANRVERLPLDANNESMTSPVNEFLDCLIDEMGSFLVDGAVEVAIRIYSKVDVNSIREAVQSIIDGVNERVIRFNTRVSFDCHQPSAPPYSRTLNNESNWSDPPPPYELVASDCNQINLNVDLNSDGGKTIKSNEHGDHVVTAQPLPKYAPVTSSNQLPLVVPVPVPQPLQPPLSGPATDVGCNCFCCDIPSVFFDDPCGLLPCYGLSCYPNDVFDGCGCVECCIGCCENGDCCQCDL